MGTIRPESQNDRNIGKFYTLTAEAFCRADW